MLDSMLNYFTVLLSFLSCIGSTLTFAETPKTRLLRKTGNWYSYAYIDGKETVCYSVAKAGDFRLILTNRTVQETRESSHHVITLISKKDFKSESKTFLIPGKGGKFELFPERNTAWAATEKDDQEIWLSLSANSKLKVTGELSQGKNFQTEFSLVGLQKAVNIIDLRCPSLGGKSSPVSSTDPSPLGSKRLPLGIQ